MYIKAGGGCNDFAETDVWVQLGSIRTRFMNAVSNATDLVPSANSSANNYVAQMTQFEHGLLKFIDQLGLPTTQVFVGVNERLSVFGHLETTIAKINIEQKQRSIYLSKFLAAVAAGLFDAALSGGGLPAMT
jgi:hypothetical protein